MSNWLELGWVDEAEFRRYFDVIPLEPPDAYERFKRWKATDGSKAGLLLAFPEMASLDLSHGITHDD